MVVTVKFCFLVFVLAGLQIVSSTRFKIVISEDERKSMQSHFAKRDGIDACMDYADVSPTSALSMLPDQLDRLREVTKFARSKVATSKMDVLFQMTVNGLNGITVQNVIDALYEEQCLFLPYGGSVRDQFLGMTPKDVDAETNCSFETVSEICINRWGSSKCIQYRDLEILQIGLDKENDGETENIDVANWENTFFGPGIHLEYTTNSMAYYAYDLGIIIDITGDGISDTCDKKIRIPVGINSDYIEMWRNNCDDTGKGCDNGEKIYRFWKLRIKGYKAIDSETRKYIVSHAKNMIMNDGARFQEFYCKNILKGEFVKENIKCNDIPASSCQYKMKYDDILEEDFEEDFEQFWQDEVKPLIEKIEIECTGGNTPSECSGDNLSSQCSGSNTSSSISTTAFCLTGIIFTALLTLV